MHELIKLKLENVEHCFSRSMDSIVFVYYNKKWPYLLHLFQRISFPSPICVKTDRWLFLANIMLGPQGRILILLNYDTVAWRNFMMMDLFIVHRIEQKKYLRLHLSNCCAYKPCVLFSMHRTLTIHFAKLVSLSRMHNPGPPGFLFHCRF